MRYLLTGAVKAGKSHRAIEIARTEFSSARAFIATAEVTDEEMAERIQKHQAERRRRDSTEEFITIEEPLELDRAILKARTLLATTQERPGIIIDCIPMWVNNLLYYQREKDLHAILEQTIAALPEDAIIVTNEIGWGNIPYDELSRRYNRLVAEVNIRLAKAVDHVELLVVGIPVRIK
ncbi:bifunctional adenosylcobinamide kinase/adenosylcobinamide-phosphate guanylyltransferase [Gracilinema caldarium]|uniref:Adenosylcobinamide kinase n=1 Tax=Gracilinema caldarium (strain ATCC 51460 / DSM 7334 / H1) TaxID=744872 RepID=F8EZB0_GRAC1|nr:bifunctional adenosylcobinamide kinase/adenosylcobinamide-phosphate guanylyltransferase [Gracilinema caldarium]AEJ19702.1 cobalbumin biosynthesis protein [Gracilinema caldarium DSM 7334]